ncbi:glycine dehydrogenase [Wickerhamomyces ciferrii]|uniref:Glycine cleavage system P protein n=1 Tax=Wickerhamomyces ciferrii (strain ATCC 14091 / BCRC 22168 / CBS 111 / JCM 3599 / NBRC 0793 / NRRL Y-1031 F-60-10) TaxID=1206466 RepID=K0KS95_WICCF|nr:glycine dehydrogenase [Wickerhamomyces ciferrii]CCH44872.1 glycine dehydrogenase [Wickerhamomyces ciferrii]
MLARSRIISSRLLNRSSAGGAAALKRTAGLSLRYNSTISTKSDVSLANFQKVYDPSISTNAQDRLKPLDNFQRRHLGPGYKDVEHMLSTLGFNDLNDFVANTVPENVLIKRKLNIQPEHGFTETEMISNLESIAKKNKVFRSFIGKGYYNTITPPVIKRNILESPEWYTSYTPYQPEVSQGRLESLLNFQTVISDLTGLPVSNASLLDEGTAAAEALSISYNNARKKKSKYVVDTDIHPQTLSVLKTRAYPLNIEIVQLDLTTQQGLEELESIKSEIFGALLQYPSSSGDILDLDHLQKISDVVHSSKGLFAVASDLLALTLLKPPSSFGADIALGSSQRFGVPMGFGGPHAAFFSVIEKLNRKIPGRIVGVSKDRLGNQALRLALQTREQHIKRDKATSNICTAQALLANIASNYAVYHGPVQLKKIAQRVYGYTSILASYIQQNSSHTIENKQWFDTLTIKLSDGVSSDEILSKAVEQYQINLFKVDESTISLSLDESITKKDLVDLTELFTGKAITTESISEFPEFPNNLTRTDKILSNPVFNLHHSETAMLRYLHNLHNKDISLANTMIPLGSCTMKLNGTVEMLPLSWPEFGSIHPFVPKNQVEGYKELIDVLEKDLANITGFSATTLQPNSGAQGEFSGLRVIKQYHESNGDFNRNICLIPVSAHGTNPASAAMSNFKVIPIECLENGSLDLEDVEKKVKQYKDNLGAIMITYPSTYGLFEPTVKRAIELVHENGGQVYLDGANMNAQVGLTSPGDLGADVCHLNLHKTFAIPHGGGGPGVGPICVAEHLIPFLPKHSIVEIEGSTEQSIESVSSAPYGSASILPISYAYIKLLGSTGLPFSSTIALLNANYMMTRLKEYYDIAFVGKDGVKQCGHEFILDLRAYKNKGIEAIDVAKRLQDYGFHAPTLAFPVPGTLMIEPTESENLEELDRFVNSLISIKSEIDAFIAGEPLGQVLKFAPHSLSDVVSSKDWETRGYTRDQAVYPLPHLRDNKFWPTVARLDDTYGDLNLLCTCPSVEEIAADQ